MAFRKPTATLRASVLRCENIDLANLTRHKNQECTPVLGSLGTNLRCLKTHLRWVRDPVAGTAQLLFDVLRSKHSSFHHVPLGTNRLQARILKGRGLTVVDDDSQSVCGFRAATIRNVSCEPHADVITPDRRCHATRPNLAARTSTSNWRANGSPRTSGPSADRRKSPGWWLRPDEPKVRS